MPVAYVLGCRLLGYNSNDSNTHELNSPSELGTWSTMSSAHASMCDCTVPSILVSTLELGLVVPSYQIRIAGHRGSNPYPRSNIHPNLGEFSFLHLHCTVRRSSTSLPLFFLSIPAFIS